MSKNILVISDSHGKRELVDSLLSKIDNYDYVIFCGDGIEDIYNMTLAFPDKIVAVVGNTDWGKDDFPDERFINIENVRIMITHGHRYNVKYGIDSLTFAARNNMADCVLFGHTHQAIELNYYGTTLINPGSLKDNGSYCEIIIKNGNIFANFLKYL